MRSGRASRKNARLRRAIGPCTDMLWSLHPSQRVATSRGERCIGIACAIGLHLAAIGAIAQYQPVREALATPAPIMVKLITLPTVEIAPPSEPPQPKPIEKPRPRHVVKKPVEPPPIITAPIEAPLTFIAPAPPPQQLTPIDAPKIDPTPSPPVTPPRFNADYLRNPAPAYPLLSRRMGEQGRVVLRVLVSPNGNPDKVELRSSSGSARLDQSALETVARWKFIPARQGDQPIAAWVLVPIAFSLES